MQKRQPLNNKGYSPDKFVDFLLKTGWFFGKCSWFKL